MLIYVLRHGITQWNKLKKVQGAMDIPLAPEGIELAKRTGEALKDVPFDICFTSPLARARQTAHYVLGNRQIPVIEDKRIQEIDFGVLEGSRFKDEQGKIISHEMEIFFEEPQKFERPQNGENISDILKRTREFWVEKTTDPALADKTILVSSHGCAVRALLQNVYQDPEHFWHGCVPPNCSINLLEVKDGKVTVNIEKEVVKKLWDNYYVPMMRGYFGAYGKYRSDDVKTGEIIAYTGSTSSADYFPDKVESDEGAREIEYMILPPPVFEGGENIMIQQGAGMVVSKSDKAHEYASCEFLKWFTQLENNYKFGSSSGYLPVLKEANNSEVFEKFVKEEQIDIKQKTYDTFENVFEYMKNATLYSTKAFKDGAAGRKVLEYAFTDKISADLEAIDNKVNDGENREKIIGDYVSDAAFEEWYNSFAETLNTACGK